MKRRFGTLSSTGCHVIPLWQFRPYYPEEMVRSRTRSRRDVSVPTPYQEARDELFQHIMQCGVVGCHPDDQKEWFDNTLTYFTERYPELGQKELKELRTLGERFAQPPKSATAV